MPEQMSPGEAASKALLEGQEALLLSLTGGTPAPSGLPPPQPSHVHCYDAKTGDLLVKHRVDVKECLANGSVVMHPKDAAVNNEEAIAEVEKQAEAAENADLESLDTAALRERFKSATGNEPHPQLGKAKLILGITEAEADAD